MRLVPLSEAELGEVLRREIAEYATAKTRAGQWRPEEAAQRARDEIFGLLKDRPREKGHRFLKGLDESDRVIGWLWVGPIPGHEESKDVRWLYQIRVEEPLRGKGYGRGLLRTLEAALAREGRTELRLNVFTYNEVARSLYDSAGYEVLHADNVGVEMRKRLAP